MFDFATRSYQRLVPAASVALFSLACVGEVGSPTDPGDVELRIHSTFSQSLDLARVGLVIDRVTATVWALPSDTVDRISQPIAVDQRDVDLAVSLPISGDAQDFGVNVQFWSGAQPLFAGQDTVQIASGAGAVDLVLEFSFVGPGGDISFMIVEPSDTTVSFGAQIPMRLEAFNGNEAPVDPYFVSWRTDDATVPIDAAGVLTAPSTPGSVLVTAVAPNGVEASATVSFGSGPASVEAASGDGVTATAGTSVDLVARVVDSGGLPLSGVSVTFAATSGGGSVNPASGVSDDSGLVTSTATLGPAVGTQTFQASVAGLAPATFTIQAILSEPAITLAPATLSFNASQGSNPSPRSRTFMVTNSGNEQLNWSAADDQTWMSVSPASGTLNPGLSATVTVTVTSASLSPATYTGTVTVSDPAAANSPQSVGVTLMVAPPGPAIGLSPTTLDFSVTQGANPANQQFTVSNVGGQALTWAASDNQPWLALTPASGSLNAGQSANVTAAVTSAALAPGTYSATVTVTSGEAVNSPQTVTVRLTVAAPPATITTSPATLSFTAQAGSNPAAQNLTIGNSGGSTLNWSATDNQIWLSLGSTSGTIAPSGSTSVPVNISSASLAAGTYNATITVSGTGASNTPQTVAVQLTVTPGPPTISLSPDTLFFTAQTGSNPASQNMTVGNSGGTSLTWSATDNQTWLSLGTTSGTVAAGGNANVAVNVASSALASGSYTGTITVTGPQATNSPQTVAVVLNVTAAPATITVSPATLSFTAQEGSNPAAQNLTIGNSGGSTLNWSGTDNQPWLSLGTTSGTVAAGGSANVAVNVASSTLAPGSYSATITLTGAQATNSPQTVAVTLTVTAAPAATIALTPDTLFFTTVEFTDPPSQPMLIENTGAAVLTWTGSDNQPWLSLGTTSGTIPAFDSTVVQVSALGGNLPQGNYSGLVTISGPGATNSPQTLVVVFTVTATPAIGVSRSRINFTAPEGLDPFNHLDTFSVTNTGTGTLNWTAVPQDGSWVSVDPSSGSLTAGQSENDILIDIFSSELSRGSYTDFVEVADPAAGNSPQLLELGLTITAFAPVIGGEPGHALLEEFDSTRCTVGSFVGHRYVFFLDYTDQDGDGDLGDFNALVDFDTLSNGEFVGAAVYQPTPPDFIEDSDGFVGFVDWQFCIAFNDDFETTLDFSMDDAGGHPSNTVSVTVFDPFSSSFDRPTPVISSSRLRGPDAALGTRRTTIRREVDRRDP